MPSPARISVIGLGYVGLPLAVALARHYDVVGFDIDSLRIEELGKAFDRTGEVESAVLGASSLRLSASPADLGGSDLFIVTVPTPVDAASEPDLSAVMEATRLVAGALRPGAVVVYESTFYPGVTEDICGPALQQASGLACGVDFHLGYSPERINPGDRAHRIEAITKVVAGQSEAVTDLLAEVYGKITQENIFRAASIKTAEAAKVIENAQRDINIAFINEVTKIFGALGLSVYDVLEAARTKWNFLDFRPGLVGGHCIGVDPFYLAHCARQLGHDPDIVLAGRRTNDGMGGYLAERIAGLLPGRPEPRVLVLGITFKENIPDIRNSKVVDLIRELAARGHRVDVHDPFADPDAVAAAHDIELLRSLDGRSGYDCVVGAVAHRQYRDFEAGDLARLLAPTGVVFDLRNMWHGAPLPAGMRRETL
jgi:UDP-N-acetyl-D-galactosamine dehydrogenase